MSNLHTFQFSLAAPVIEGVKRLGSPLDRLFRETGLHRFDVRNPEAYAPLSSLYAVFDTLRVREGVTVPAEAFAHEFKLEALGSWGELLAYSPTLLEGCLMAQRLATANLSSQRIRLEIDGARATLINWFTDADGPGRRELENQALILLIQSIRLAAGPDWAPLEIFIPADPKPWMIECLPLDRSLIRIRTGMTGVTMSTETLSLPMLSPSRDAIGITVPDVGQSAGQHIRQVLDSFVDPQSPTVDTLASLFDTSARTLQRRLAEEGQSFSGVIAKWRFETAVRLLANPSISVTEVSERLRYENVSNFERAFKRWTGTAAGRYREQLP